jgi:thiamine-phosphate pyrophosphorylase
MNWKKSVFKTFKLYAVTDVKEPGDAILRKINDAYRGGADIVQLRSKTASDEALFLLGLKIRKIADRWEKLFFVNDRLDLALAVKADGLHVGQDDLPVKVIRRICKKAKAKIWLGKSTHSLRQALSAANEGVDYIGVGPIFETPTKPDYQAVGLPLIQEVKAKVSIPFVVIGGIDHHNISHVIAAGATRVAVVRAAFSGKDVYANTKKLRSKIERERNAGF